VRFGSFTTQMAQFFEAAVLARQNIVISGGTGSGKTTLLNVLSSFVPEDERIVTIEDSAELQLPQEHVVRLETRHCFPFTHNLVYGLGKALVERQRRDRDLSAAGRYAFWGEQPRLTPTLLAIKLFTTVDVLNRGSYDKGPALSLCVKAVRPEATLQSESEEGILESTLN